MWEDISEYRGRCSVPWGVILSTVGDTQYRGRYHEYRGENIFCYMSTPMVLNTPTVLMISPICIMISSTVLSIPHDTQDNPTFIMISPTVLHKRYTGC